MLACHIDGKSPRLCRTLGAAAQCVQHDKLPVHAGHGGCLQLDRLHPGHRPGATAVYQVPYSIQQGLQ